MNIEDKVQFNVYISKATNEQFHKLVAAKHQIFKRGLVSYEAEMALRQYLASYKSNDQHTHTSTNPDNIQVSNPPPKIFMLKNAINKYLVDCGMYAELPHFVIDKQLQEAIGHIKGFDQRTIKKWIGLLKRYGCIKESGIHQYEFV